MIMRCPGERGPAAAWKDPACPRSGAWGGASAFPACPACARHALSRAGNTEWRGLPPALPAGAAPARGSGRAVRGPGRYSACFFSGLGGHAIPPAAQPPRAIQRHGVAPASRLPPCPAASPLTRLSGLESVIFPGIPCGSCHSRDVLKQFLRALAGPCRPAAGKNTFL